MSFPSRALLLPRVCSLRSLLFLSFLFVPCLILPPFLSFLSLLSLCLLPPLHALLFSSRPLSTLSFFFTSPLFSYLLLSHSSSLLSLSVHSLFSFPSLPLSSPRPLSTPTLPSSSSLVSLSTPLIHFLPFLSSPCPIPTPSLPSRSLKKHSCSSILSLSCLCFSPLHGHSFFYRPL